MDPAHLLQAPLVSNPVFSKMMGEATTRGIVWGHTVEYKSCSLDTLPDNKKPVLRSAPWPAMKRFNPSDTKNPNAKYDDPHLGTKPMSLPYARGVSTGLHEPGIFPAQPHGRDPVDGASVTVKYHMLKEPRTVISVADIEGAQSRPKLGPARSEPVNPLNPMYSLATSQPVPIPEPKFIRDSIPCADISSDARLKLFSSPRQSATMYCDDISGTRSRQRIKGRNAPYKPGAGIKALPLSLDTLTGADIYDEVNRLPFKFKRSARHTDPMDPKYRYNVPSNEPPQGPMLGHKLSGERPGIVPKDVSEGWTLPGPEKVRVKRFSTGAKFLNFPGPQYGERPGYTQLPGDVTYREYMLRSEDIQGAQHSTKGRFQSRTSPFYRTQEGRSNCTEDIEKAKPTGPFTLLPAHILTRRLAQSLNSSAETARAIAGFQVSDPQSKQAWATQLMAAQTGSVLGETPTRGAVVRPVTSSYDAGKEVGSPKPVSNDFEATMPQPNGPGRRPSNDALNLSTRADSYMHPALGPASGRMGSARPTVETAGGSVSRPRVRSAVSTPRSSGPRVSQPSLNIKLLAALVV